MKPVLSVFSDSLIQKNKIRNILSGFIILVFLIFVSCGKKDNTYTYDPTSNTDNSSTTSTDNTPPTVSSTSPINGDTSVSISTSISVTFSESMDTSSITTNISNSSCSGTIQVSSNNFSSCNQMSSNPSISNDNKTFTVTPTPYLSNSTVYMIRVTTGVNDTSGNPMEIQRTTLDGFRTGNQSDTTSPTVSSSSPTN